MSSVCYVTSRRVVSWSLSFFFNTFIYQHAPLLMSNTTCIVLNFTYYDLSCLYTLEFILF